jgi:hypothetical protein
MLSMEARNLREKTALPNRPAKQPRLHNYNPEGEEAEWLPALGPDDESTSLKRF